MKQQYQSSTIRAAAIVILIAVLRFFGFIGADEQVTVTIDDMTKPKQAIPSDQLIDIGLAAAGYSAIKGRKNVGDIKPLLGTGDTR